MKEISLYLHFPFCKQKCHYCDFYSIEIGNQYFLEYIDTIVREIKWQSKKYKNSYQIGTIYFGGGTPNIFPSRDLIKVLKNIQNNFNVKNDAEITVELNPEFCKDKLFFEDLKLAGFNRLSIGAQSMHNDELKFLGRIHNHKATIDAINNIVQSGFDNYSLDLIFNIPKQTKEKITTTINEFLSFNPKHISAYSLTKEIGTKYYQMIKSGETIENSNEIDSEHFKLCHNLLEENKFSHYEISNYSHGKYESKHNSNYWNGTDYLGFGPSAHSKIGEKRFWHNPSLSNYFGKNKNNNFTCDDSEILGVKQKITELLMIKFRIKSGIKRNDMDIQNWIKINSAVKYINKKYSKNYFITDNNRISPTIDAWLILD
ncbi:MAG: radical SAM family heme chaperone HemW, partial [Candidatus Marinimicrobia bacterium]|nr:radical SAM family heme chaperone HemW [Candidatus Neomarinimicrobiota bacterium]